MVAKLKDLLGELDGPQVVVLALQLLLKSGWRLRRVPSGTVFCRPRNLGRLRRSLIGGVAPIRRIGRSPCGFRTGKRRRGRRTAGAVARPAAMPVSRLIRIVFGQVVVGCGQTPRRVWREFRR